MFRRIHLLLGLLLALPLFVQATTGAFLVFEREIDAWLNREQFFVEPTGTRMSAQGQFDAFAAARPDMREHVYIMRLPAAPDEATLMLAKPYNQVGPRAGVRFFVNPYTGVVGDEQPYHTTLTGKVYNLHRTFWLPRWGRWITSTSALLSVALTLSGVAWFAIRRREANTTSSSLLRLWHRRVGLTFSPLIVTIALNGALVTYLFLAIHVVYAVTGTEMPKEMREGRSTRIENLPVEGRRTLDDLIRAANEQFPSAEPRVLLQPSVADKAVTVVLKKPHEPRSEGGTMVAMHPGEGRALGWTDFTDGDVGHQVIYWMHHLHKGTWGGKLAGDVGKLATRILWVFAALTAASLIVSGATLWRASRDAEIRLSQD